MAFAGEEERFRGELAGSVPAAKRVAEYYRQRGYSVVVPKLLIRPTFEDRAKYRDGGDVIIKKGREWRVEVKRRKLSFTYDFPYDTVNIDRVNKPLSDMYVIVNEAMTHAAFISTRKTRSEWTVESTRDNVKGYGDYKVYRCHKRLFTFRELPICS